ncbi:4Fe-4S binding protein [bacterium]|nr:4Fe-4S binding protein [bacterium]
MKLNFATLVYFSPTGTTRRVLEAIAAGLGCDNPARVDLTPATADHMPAVELDSRLTVIGVPVYSGRVPAVAVRRLGRIKAHGAPVVLVVVYGNREFEDALRELKDLAAKAGFKTVAAGAFIGEHSFSSEKQPLAAGRPDERDLAAAVDFGAQVRRRVIEAESVEQIPAPQVPGNFPYIERDRLTGIAPVSLADSCTECGTCASVCPVEAIIVGPEAATDTASCILCCACVRACASGARVMQDGKFEFVTNWLATNCSVRKTPVTFL